MRPTLSPEPIGSYPVTNWPGFNIVSQGTEGSEERERQEMSGYWDSQNTQYFSVLCIVCNLCGPQITRTMTIETSQIRKKIIIQMLMRITNTET